MLILFVSFGLSGEAYKSSTIFVNMLHSKGLSAKCQQFVLDLNVLKKATSEDWLRTH